MNNLISLVIVYVIYNSTILLYRVRVLVSLSNSKLLTYISCPLIEYVITIYNISILLYKVIDLVRS